MNAILSAKEIICSTSMAGFVIPITNFAASTANKEKFLSILIANKIHGHLFSTNEPIPFYYSLREMKY